jgi:hypothetical protein
VNNGERLAMRMKARLGGLLLLPLRASADPACIVPDARKCRYRVRSGALS